MKKFLGLLSILALSFGLVIAACGGDDGGSEGEKDTVEQPGEDAEAPGEDAETPGEDGGGCTPACTDKECGDDTCGGSCGQCLPGIACLDTGLCDVPPADCEGKECGPDGIGGSCGTCGEGFVCNEIAGLCEADIDPCEGKQCGNWDGQWCGDCPCADCPETFDECNLDTGMCEEGAPEKAGCPAIFDCMNGCPEGDQGCQQNCINSASIDDQMAFNNLYQCWVDVDLWGCWDLCPEGTEYADCPPDFHECMDEKDALCEDEYFECFVPGDLTCEEIFDCFNTCPDDDTPCMQACYQSGSQEAQQAASAMWDCYEEEGVYDGWDLCPEDAQSTNDCPPEGQECFEVALEKCQEITYACFPPGTMNCFDMSLCVYTCPEGNDDCVQDCFGEGSVEAADGWNAIINCLEDNGYFECPENDTECIETAYGACSEEVYACRSGEATCKEVWDCLDTCGPMDEVCTLECIWNGTGEAQDGYNAVIDCVIEMCGQEADQECMNNALAGDCSSSYNECLAL